MSFEQSPEQQHAECIFEIGKFASCVTLVTGMLSSHALLVGHHGTSDVIVQLQDALEQLNLEVANFIDLVKQKEN